jgi:cytochrome c biogenesis protein CcmG/thiol:disulfide interchange protein DsbE
MAEAIRMSRGLRLIPIILLVWLVIGFAWRLVKPTDPAIPSQLVERPVPTFDLPPAIPMKAGIKSSDLAGGQPRLVNIFASWCVPCLAEAPVLKDLRNKGVKIDAIAVRDTSDGVSAFLASQGDPYERIGADANSRVQIAFGSSGVPETFVVDGRGVVRHQYIGPLSEGNVPEVLQQLAEAR